MREQHPEVYQRLRNGDMVLPAVFVDSAQVSQGFIDYFTISRALAKARAATGRES